MLPRNTSSYDGGYIPLGATGANAPYQDETSFSIRPSDKSLSDFFTNSNKPLSLIPLSVCINGSPYVVNFLCYYTRSAQNNGDFTTT